MNNRLGKGIGALIKTSDLNQEEYLDGFIEVNKIKINPEQPRKYFDEKSLDELVHSIKEKGILQPITIRVLDSNAFELIAGERRFRAAKILKLKTIPAYIIKVNSDVEKLELALIENIQRNDLNVIEEAEAYAMLSGKYELSHEEIAERVCKNRSTIANSLRLLKLPTEIKSAVKTGKISAGHARAILGIRKSLHMMTLYDQIIKEGLNVRQTESLAKKSSEKLSEKSIIKKTSGKSS